jgi:6-phosphogluconolactonase
MKRFFLLFSLVISSLLQAQEQYMIVGTYDSPKSEGIYVYKFNLSDGSTKEINHVKTSNPSFLAISPDKKYVYAVNENADSSGRGGSVSSFSFDKKTGKLSLLSKQSSGGNHPCYVTTDKTGKWVLAGNYSTGNFVVLPVKKGIPGKAKLTIQHTGSGPDTTRQKSPHVHGIFMKRDNTGFFVTDLGTDKMMDYSFNPDNGFLDGAKTDSIMLTPGSGPRHLEFHPKLQVTYILNELSGTIDVLHYLPFGDIVINGRIPAFPSYFKEKAGSADIHVSPDGRFLYCSNRGTLNDIAIFSIEQANGKITWLGDQSTLGIKPRNFNFDPSGNYLLVANQDSDEIVIFRRDIQTGLLTDTGNRVKVGKPVCIQWIPVK